MYCVINGYGAVVRKKQNRFVVESEGESKEFPAVDLRQILLTDAAMITTGALSLAAESGTDIAIIGRDGTPICRFISCAGTGTAATRKNQVLFSQGEQAYHFISRIISAKIQNMGLLLQAIGRRKNDGLLIDEGQVIALSAAHLQQTGTLPADAPHLRGIEGEASRRYFQALTHVLPEDVYKGSRTHRPAGDVFNAALNYGYGILYHEVEKACLIAGLEPEIGYLHADRYGKTPFVYDVIEQFRQPVIDRAIITLAVRGRISSSDLDEKGFLTQDSRKVIIGEVIGRLTGERELNGINTTFTQLILNTMRSAVHTINEGKTFTPYIHRWR